jgi:hypothetical protein
MAAPDAREVFDPVHAEEINPNGVKWPCNCHSGSLAVRCGVDSFWDAADAAQHIFGSILADAARTLDRDAWIRVCKRFLNYVHMMALVCPPVATPEYSCEGLEGFLPAGLALEFEESAALKTFNGEFSTWAALCRTIYEAVLEALQSLLQRVRSRIVLSHVAFISAAACTVMLRSVAFAWRRRGKYFLFFQREED